MIPVLDCEGDVVSKSQKLAELLKQDGFVYLRNCGIDFKMISSTFRMGDKLWALSKEEKDACARDADSGCLNGYVGPMTEFLNPFKPENRKTEVREAYNFNATYPLDGLDVIPPIEGFHSTMTTLYEMMYPVAENILRAAAIGLGYKINDFTKSHHFGSQINTATIRLLHYPPPSEDIRNKMFHSEVSSGSISLEMDLRMTSIGAERCGEHSDYGSITLLFQDDVGGLQIKRKDGSFIDVKFEPDAVLVNTGDVLQRWTSDTVMAVRHRVVVKSTKEMREASRRSIVFFVHADDDAIIAPLDGSDLYPTMTSHEHLNYMYSKIYT